MPVRCLSLVLLAVVVTGCDRAAPSDAPAAPAPAGSVAASPVVLAAPSAPAATASSAPRARARGSCGATRVVAAGETLAGISLECYGSNAYGDRLQKRNGLPGSVVKAGATLATPPLAELFAPCAPREVCDPIFAAHAAFVPAQSLTEHAAIAPDTARPALDRTKRSLEDALKAAEASKVTRPRTQLKAALDEVEGLRSGARHEPGYAEHAFHQHLVYALDALTR